MANRNTEVELELGLEDFDDVLDDENDSGNNFRFGGDTRAQLTEEDEEQLLESEVESNDDRHNTEVSVHQHQEADNLPTEDATEAPEILDEEADVLQISAGDVEETVDPETDALDDSDPIIVTVELPPQFNTQQQPQQHQHRPAPAVPAALPAAASAAIAVKRKASAPLPSPAPPPQPPSRPHQQQQVRQLDSNELARNGILVRSSEQQQQQQPKQTIQKPTEDVEVVGVEDYATKYEQMKEKQARIRRMIQNQKEINRMARLASSGQQEAPRQASGLAAGPQQARVRTGPAQPPTAPVSSRLEQQKQQQIPVKPTGSAAAPFRASRGPSVPVAIPATRAARPHIPPQRQHQQQQQQINQQRPVARQHQTVFQQPILPVNYTAGGALLPSRVPIGGVQFPQPITHQFSQQYPPHQLPPYAAGGVGHMHAYPSQQQQTYMPAPGMLTPQQQHFTSAAAVVAAAAAAAVSSGVVTHGRRSVRITNCPPGVTNGDLLLYTDLVGPAENCQVYANQGQAYITFRLPQHAEEFVQRFNRANLKGYQIQLSLC